MGRFCYCSEISPGKSDRVRDHWKTKSSAPHEEDRFWDALQMTGFESWLQPTDQGDLMVHCLEGASLEGIFQGLRGEIEAKNRVALGLQEFYLDVLNKNYQSPEAQPKIECLLDLELPLKKNKIIKKGFVYPLLSHKEQAHRKFRQESNGEKKARHLASLEAFGVFRFTSWLQSTSKGKYIVCYTERNENSSGNALGISSTAWQEIAKELMDQTALAPEALNPKVEWLTAPVN